MCEPGRLSALNKEGMQLPMGATLVVSTNGTINLHLCQFQNIINIYLFGSMNCTIISTMKGSIYSA